ncbi:MAG: TRAP transporter TatT component family protein [Planctomycetales bacterium]|nr:TRAP transporter TatT component family protein [Planctomycetales bacterium]
MRQSRMLTIGAATFASSLAAPVAGCSIQKMAVNTVGDALAGSGGTFASDDDWELVRDAIPFGLKLQESLLAVSPEHRGLLLATASGFAQYAYGFVVQEADRVDATDLARARELRARARKLFLRARDFALRGLEVAYPGFREKLRSDSKAALAEVQKEDAALLYWAGAPWTAALQVKKDDLDLMAELPLAASLVARVLELDETWNRGAAHEFFISYEGSRSAAMGGSPERAREHYRRALEISGGKRASVHLALAESVVLRDQADPKKDALGEFRRLLGQALAVDPDADPPQRLTNVLARRRAQWLSSRIPDLFLDTGEPGSGAPDPGEERKE